MAERSFVSKFHNLDRDIERYLERFGVWDKSGPTPLVHGYDKALQTVFDLYLDNKAYVPVVQYLLMARTWEHGLNDHLLQASERLQQDGRIGLLNRLWRGIIAVQRQFYWELRAHAAIAEVDKSILAAKTRALETMAMYRAIASDFASQDDVRWADGEIEMLRAGRRRTAQGKPGGEKMAAAIAYEARNGKFLTPLRPGSPAPKGTPWQEDALAETYPDLVRHYAQVSVRRILAARRRRDCHGFRLSPGWAVTIV